MNYINGQTKTIGVMGNPVEHTLSPIIQNTISAELGQNYVYAPYHVFDAARAIEGVRALGFAGINITIPHKGAVIENLDFVDDYARRAGAVNTVVNRGGRLFGYNTDGEGLLASLSRAGANPGGAVVAILGAGGAARGAALSLEAAGAGKILIINRSAKAAGELCAALKNVAAVDSGALPGADILINATPVGMHKNAGASPLSEPWNIKPGGAVLDMIYNPRETALLKTARGKGLKTINGLGMLIYQAAASYALFTGVAVPRELSDMIYRRLSLEKNIVLTGFMGAGKTTVGREISRLISCDFIDSDEYIEEKHKKSPADIIKQSGEAHFREVESAAVRELAAHRGAVIALGGGAVLNRENINLLRENAVVIRLSARAETIMKNTGKGQNRPLIAGKSKEQVEGLLKEREPYYKNCAREVSVEGQSVSAVAQRVLCEYWEEIGALKL